MELAGEHPVFQALLPGKEPGFKAILWISLYFMRMTYNFNNMIASWNELSLDVRSIAVLPLGQATTMQTYPLTSDVLATLPAEEVDVVLQILAGFPVEYEKVTNRCELKLVRTGWDERIAEIKQYFNRQ